MEPRITKKSTGWGACGAPIKEERGFSMEPEMKLVVPKMKLIECFVPIETGGREVAGHIILDPNEVTLFESYPKGSKAWVFLDTYLQAEYYEEDGLLRAKTSREDNGIFKIGPGIIHRIKNVGKTKGRLFEVSLDIDPNCITYYNDNRQPI